MATEYVCMVQIRVPKELLKAMQKAAKAKFQTQSDYCRQAIIEQIAADDLAKKQ